MKSFLKHFSSFFLLSFCCQLAVSQAVQEKLERFKSMSLRNEEKGLAEPFKGITTDGTVQKGIFELEKTGVSTESVRTAALNFLSSLDDDQKEKTTFSLDDNEWRMWMNQHFYIRQGVGFDEMSETQRQAAFNLMSTSLSASGLKLSRDIMKLNHTLGEINNNFDEYGEWLYYITIMGEPSATEPWGWQMDGHHLIINYFIVADQVVMTPLFVGSEPVIAETGKYKGISILQDEQNMGLKMFKSLNETQKKEAVIEVTKEGNNNLTEAFKDNVVIGNTGVKVSALSKIQQEQLLSLINLYIDNMDEGHGKVKMDEVRRFISETRFSWIGGTEDNAVYYYRIYSPVILIEFDHQTPVGTKQLYGNTPHRQHIHAVVRTPNGNDYGKDLLRQHYQKNAHK
ncbi:MAG: DUF3500 domain-containing protein [Cyclobacteriaceae bacterium]|jgi:hypothetical protein|nr:DUF3500 domain-containing protein [Cyclobacteriaceae bacterium]